MRVSNFHAEANIESLHVHKVIQSVVNSLVNYPRHKRLRLIYIYIYIK